MGWSEPKRYGFEDPEPKIGPGISRPRPTESARLFRLRVKIPSTPQMTITLPALPNPKKQGGMDSQRRDGAFHPHQWDGLTEELIRG